MRVICAALIDVFTVAPEDQQRLLDVLAEGTEPAMNGTPGFVSANLHRTFDGTKTVNYARWRSKEGSEAMLENPVVAGHMREATMIAEKFEPRLYQVSFVGGVRG